MLVAVLLVGRLDHFSTSKILQAKTASYVSTLMGETLHGYERMIVRCSLLSLQTDYL